MSPTVAARCVIYARVSTKEQVSNLSLETQREACAAFARARGWTVVEVFTEEGESAKTTDRTQLRRMLAHLKARRDEIGYVLVYSLSRLSRNTHDHLGLRLTFARQGAVLRSVTEPIDETPSGKLMETLMSGVAQMQNDQLSERVTAGMRAAIERGRWPYPAVTGYRNVRGRDGRPTFEADPERAPLVREAFQLAADGVALGDVLGQLHAKGLTTRQGRRLNRKALAEILRNPIYAGILRVPRWQIEARAAFEPIVDGALWRAVQARLAGKDRPYELHQRQNPDFALKGLVRHVTCDRPLVGYWSKGRSGRHAYYDCPVCPKALAPREKLEAAFAAMLDRDGRLSVEDLAVIRLEAVDAWTERERQAAADAGGLMRRAAALRERKARLAAAYTFERAMDRETYDRLLAELQGELDGVQQLLDRAEGERLDAAGLVDFVVEVMSEAGRRWESADLARRQALQEFTYPEGARWGREEGLSRTAVRTIGISEIEGVSGDVGGVGGPRVFSIEPWLRAARKLQRAWGRAA